jgi:hypothetical protein
MRKYSVTIFAPGASGEIPFSIIIESDTAESAASAFFKQCRTDDGLYHLAIEGSLFIIERTQVHRIVVTPIGAG